jgi:hypothetical protein
LRELVERIFVLGTDALLAVYYLGFGFLIILAWMAIAHMLNETLTAARRTMFHRLALGLAAAGVLHPAFALTGRDIAVQLGRDDGPADPAADRTMRVANVGVAASFCVVIPVLASHLARFEDVPVLQALREWLPFA